MRTSLNFVNVSVGVLTGEFREEKVIGKPSTCAADQAVVLIVKLKLTCSVKARTKALVTFTRLPLVLD